LIRPLEEEDLEELDWKSLAEKRLRDAWKDSLYDYL
jgi:hypothetical protein